MSTSRTDLGKVNQNENLNVVFAQELSASQIVDTVSIGSNKVANGDMQQKNVQQTQQVSQTITANMNANFNTGNTSTPSM